MSKSFEDIKLPSDPATWKALAGKHDLQGKSIHTLETTHSGSGISLEQFLLLRTLWSKHAAEDLIKRDKRHFIGDKMLAQAEEYLSPKNNKFGWNEYLGSLLISFKTLQQRGFIEPKLGAFALVRWHQAKAQDLTSGEYDNESVKVDMSPIAYRTRNRLRQKADPQSTPTPASKVTDVTTRMGRITIRDSNREPSASRTSPHTPPSTRGRTNSPHPQELARASSSAPQGSVRSGSSGSTSEPISSPFEDPRLFPAIKDEQIVKTALIDFLIALSMNVNALRADWTLHRLSLVARDYSQRNATAAQKKTYEARVDGYLENRQGQSPLVIVEVKPFQRSRKPNAIRMQESAQMAAWINNYPPPMGQHPDESKDIK